jgi:hypothetical protein
MVIKRPKKQTQNHIGIRITVKTIFKIELIRNFIEANIENIFVNFIFFCQFY